MKISIRRRTLVALCGTVLSGPGMAATLDLSTQEPASAAAGSATSATSAPAMTEGEVRKIDKAQAKITLRHGEIKNLDMPAMTMVFQVRPPALLDKLKAGDKVRFRADKADTGFVVTAIEPAP